MLDQILKNLAAEKKKQGVRADVIKNILKEVLQFYVLDFIFNSSFKKNLIFTGGSALRICFGLNRLSEDLDFDLESDQKIDKNILAAELINYFKRTLKFEKINFSIKGKTQKIYLKFPILYDLGLAKIPESDNLYVKVEIENNMSKFGKMEITPISKFNLNFLIKSYSLKTLLANKILAILFRPFKKGKNDLITFKGRDYYDLLWMFQKGIKPDLKRLTDILGSANEKEISKKLLEKIKNINPTYLKEDLLPLFEDSRFINNYAENYQEMVEKYLKFNFSNPIP